MQEKNPETKWSSIRKQYDETLNALNRMLTSRSRQTV